MTYYVPPALVPQYWPSVEAGLARAIAMSHYETSAVVVKELLESGKAFLVITVEGDRQTGFGIVEPYTTSRGYWLNIIFAYCESRKSVIEGYQHIAALARQLGAIGVKLFSSRPGMARLARRLGMTPRFVEYVQEVI